MWDLIIEHVKAFTLGAAAALGVGLVGMVAWFGAGDVIVNTVTDVVTESNIQVEVRLPPEIERALIMIAEGE